MGRRIVALASEASDFTLVCTLERLGHADLGKDAGLVAGVGQLGIRIQETVSGAPDVLLDFSSPDGCMARAAECARLGIAVVIGTTGLSEEQGAKIRSEVAAKVPVLIAPNMSVGVNLLCALTGQVAAALGEEYDVEIVEMHHRRKKDAPSGTALQLARCVCEGLSWDGSQALVYGRQGVTGERPRRQIAVHAVRGGDVVGDHTVIFAGEGERIELTHRASSRDVFVRGALRAARFLAGRPAGLYGMKDVLS
jgi:4-hydroxy-tetrahydrodipicolinate reductase